MKNLSNFGSFDPYHDAWFRAMEGMDHYYRIRVVTNDKECHYKAQAEVKWIDPDNHKCEGVVIGAIQAPAEFEPTYVVLHTKIDQVRMQSTVLVQMGEMILMHGWYEPEQEMSSKQEPSSDDVPF